MTKNVETIQPTKTTFDAIQIMKSKGFLDIYQWLKKKIVGILSMRDLYDYANNELQDSLKNIKNLCLGRDMEVKLRFLSKVHEFHFAFLFSKLYR